MRHQVATAAVSPISSTTREKTAKRSPKSRLFIIILFSMLGGIYLTEGFHDLGPKSKYRSAFDFLVAAAYLIGATDSGIRLLNGDKPRRLAADADSVLRVSDLRQA